MSMVRTEQAEFLATIEQRATEEGIEIYLVGGVVRDLLRGGVIGEKDFDFVVVGDAAQFAARCVGVTGGTVKRFDHFLTAKIVQPQLIPWLDEVDFASSRTEVYPRPGQLPVVSPGSLELDLARRDFSINAIALRVGVLLDWLADGGVSRSALRERVIDRHGGCADLDERVVRSLHPASFRDDPTRLFRASRYVARIEGRLAQDTERDIVAALGAGALGTISTARIVNELKKVSTEGRFPEAIRLLGDVGVGAVLGVPLGAETSGVVERIRGLAVPAVHRFEVLVRAWYGAAEERGEGARVVAALGLGVKQARHVAYDVAAEGEALAGNRVTVAGLWYAYVAGRIDGATLEHYVARRREHGG